MSHVDSISSASLGKRATSWHDRRSCEVFRTSRPPTATQEGSDARDEPKKCHDVDHKTSSTFKDHLFQHFFKQIQDETNVD